jgi:radical SAM protein (TIGR01212 family)
VNRPRLRTFSLQCRERYGYPIGKIPLDLGIPCPNRARGGCLFCQPASFTPFALRATDPLDEQIHRGKDYLLRGRFRHYLGYFQQETPTALTTAQLVPQLARILTDPDCRGLILSTRPDAIADDLPGALADLVRGSGKTCLVELGLQSIHEQSLRLLNRNHSFADFLNTLTKLRAVKGLEVGVHLILGIPEESEADMLATVRTVGALPIHALKLHHLLVIAATPLHRLYQEGRVPVFTREYYLELLLRLIPHIPAHVTLHRLWATAHPHLLVAPQWHCLASELSEQLLDLMTKHQVWQGQETTVEQPDPAA